MRGLNMKIQVMKCRLMAAILLLGSTTAYAGCPQNSLAGTWEIFILKADSDSIALRSCSLNLANNGNISSGTCKTYEGPEASVSGDKISSSMDCSVTGAIVIDGVTYTISDGQINRNKFDMSGVGTTSTGLFTFNGVKK